MGAEEDISPSKRERKNYFLHTYICVEYKIFRSLSFTCPSVSLAPRSQRMMQGGSEAHCTCSESVSQLSNLEFRKPQSYKGPQRDLFHLIYLFKRKICLNPEGDAISVFHGCHKTCRNTMETCLQWALSGTC